MPPHVNCVTSTGSKVSRSSLSMFCLFQAHAIIIIIKVIHHRNKQTPPSFRWIIKEKKLYVAECVGNLHSHIWLSSGTTQKHSRGFVFPNTWNNFFLLCDTAGSVKWLKDDDLLCTCFRRARARWFFLSWVNRSLSIIIKNTKFPPAYNLSDVLIKVNLNKIPLHPSSNLSKSMFFLE